MKVYIIKNKLWRESMKKKGLYRKLSMSELKNIFGGEMLDDQGRKIVRKNLDGVYSIKD